jgi:hypothetical protein
MEYEVDMRRLCPQALDVWEIRSHVVKPQLRLFGWFVLPKLFVVVHGAVRDDLDEGGRITWERAIETADDARTTMGLRSVDWREDPDWYLQNPR